MPAYYDDTPRESDGEDREPPATPVAFVSTQEPIAVNVLAVEDERTPEGMVCMGTYLNERLIARSVVPPETLRELHAHDTFAEPVRLGLAAVEGDPGLQCRLFALLPATQFRESDEPEEPWAASVPRFEDSQKMEVPEDAIVPILLGHIVRFQKDRKHPDDLPAEAVDVMRTIVAEDQPLSNVVDKVLRDLLDDIQE